jgi:hypothetical protein
MSKHHYHVSYRPRKISRKRAMIAHRHGYVMPGQERPLNWRQFVKSINRIASNIGEALSTMWDSMKPVFAAIEDITRDNAYHPKGPVVRGTAFGLPEDTPPRDQKLLP